MASYFALAGGRALRLALSREAQESLDAIFQNALSEFRREDAERVTFDGKYKPDDDELLAIQDFEVPDFITDAIENPAGCARLDLSANVGQTPHINAIFSSHSGILCFQRFMQSQFLTRHKMSLVYSRNTFSRMTDPGLTVRSDLACIVEDGSLLFQSFFVARTIFDLSLHYREATDEDLESFAHHEKLLIEDHDEFVGYGDQRLRRMVAVVMDSGVLDRHSPGQISRRARGFGIELPVSRSEGRERIKLPRVKRDLKIALKFLQEDVYRGPLSEQAFVSNSKTALGN